MEAAGLRIMKWFTAERVALVRPDQSWGFEVQPYLGVDAQGVICHRQAQRPAGAPVIYDLGHALVTPLRVGALAFGPSLDPEERANRAHNEVVAQLRHGVVLWQGLDQAIVSSLAGLGVLTPEPNRALFSDAQGQLWSGSLALGQPFDCVVWDFDDQQRAGLSLDQCCFTLMRAVSLASSFWIKGAYCPYLNQALVR